MSLEEMIKSAIDNMDVVGIIQRSVESAINDSIHQMFMSDNGQTMIKNLMGQAAPQAVAEALSAEPQVIQNSADGIGDPV